MRKYWVVLFATVAAHTFGADAVFSGDGDHVYYVDVQRGALADTDLITRSRSFTRLEPSDRTLRFVDMSRGTDGVFLFLTKTELWQFKPATKEWKKCCSVPSGLEFERVAYNPKDGSTLLMTHSRESRLFLMPRDRAELQPVWIRRHDVAVCPIFDTDGQLYFSYAGFVWCGSIESDNRLETNGPRPFLAAYSYAPLNSLETADTTPLESGAYEIAPAGEFLYVAMHRIGGSGWGALVRIPRPHVKRGSYDDFDVRGEINTRLGLYADVMRSAQIVYDQWPETLCAAADGRRVYFTSKNREFLLTNGKLEQLTIAEQ